MKKVIIILLTLFLWFLDVNAQNWNLLKNQIIKKALNNNSWSLNQKKQEILNKIDARKEILKEKIEARKNLLKEKISKKIEEKLKKYNNLSKEKQKEIYKKFINNINLKLQNPWDENKPLLKIFKEVLKEKLENLK